MACEGCANRREAIKRWLRSLIGAAPRDKSLEMFAKLDEHQDKEFARVDKAFNDQDEIVGNWLKELQAELDEARKEFALRMTILRELNKNCKEMIRNQDDRIRGLEDELSALTNDVQNIEFPDFQSVDDTVSDVDGS